MAGPTLRLSRDGDRLVISDGKNVRRSEIDIEHHQLRRGYFVVQARGSRGYHPVVEIPMEHGRPVILSVRDTRMVHYWRGDDPWQRIYENGEILPEATHFADGIDWQRLMITLGFGGELQSTPLQGA